MYVKDMARLWRNTLNAMGQMEVDDAIYFPFGMGAFLRCLGQCDSRYDRPEKMRRLRKRLADEFMHALCDICFPQLGKDAAGPRRVHLCLLCTSAESIQNHNVFIEAAAERAQRQTNLFTVLQL